MPRYRVNIKTGLPPQGFVIVDRPTQQQAESLVAECLQDNSTTHIMDDVLYDDQDTPSVAGSELATEAYGPMNDGEEWIGYGC